MPPGGARPIPELEPGGHRLKPRPSPFTSHGRTSPGSKSGLGGLRNLKDQKKSLLLMVYEIRAGEGLRNRLSDWGKIRRPEDFSTDCFFSSGMLLIYSESRLF